MPAPLKALIAAAIVPATLLLAACGGSDPGWDARGIAESQQDAPFFPFITPDSAGLIRATMDFSYLLKNG